MVRFVPGALAVLIGGAGCAGWALGERYRADDAPTAAAKDDHAADRGFLGLYHHKERPSYRSTHLFPLFWHSEGDFGRELTVFPFWWSSSHRDPQQRDAFMLWPLFSWHSSPRTDSLGLAPPVLLFEWFGDGGARVRVVPGLVETVWREDQRELNVLGFGRWSVLRIASVGAEFEASLWPIWSYQQSPLGFSVHLWPLFSFSREGEEYAFTVLEYLIRRTESPSKSEFSLLGLHFGENEDEERRAGDDKPSR